MSLLSTPCVFGDGCPEHALHEHGRCDPCVARAKSIYAIRVCSTCGVDLVAGVCPECPFTAPKPEAVNHPAHYGGADNPYEAIKVIEAWGVGFNLGTVLKYIARHEHKGSALEDLRKARWYLDREIAARVDAENGITQPRVDKPVGRRK